MQLDMDTEKRESNDLPKVQIPVLECGKEESVRITYERAYDNGLCHEITEARYKGVVMNLDEFDDLVFIYGMESANKGKGECQEMIAFLKEDFKGKRFGSSPPVNKPSKHILDKMGVNYKDYMK